MCWPQHWSRILYVRPLMSQALTFSFRLQWGPRDDPAEAAAVQKYMGLQAVAICKSLQGMSPRCQSRWIGFLREQDICFIHQYINNTQKSVQEGSQKNICWINAWRAKEFDFGLELLWVLAHVGFKVQGKSILKLFFPRNLRVAKD